MSLYTYIAENNPQEANNLLNNYGFKPTDSYSELITRLKSIVRKYKKVALQDLMEIHPDKKLFNSFTNSDVDVSEKEFAYATGRTPGFADPIIEPKSNFEERDNTNTAEVLAQIKEVKQQVRRNRVNRNKVHTGNVVKQAGMMGQTEFLMMAVAFALGYLIGKK